ncbi:basic proline-rich protein-like [Canis lupus familiaris]|uniref:basic proline-rich protein-like n=1 Tax=Canis lupus familiaris TaxID=9615 RepID=UPI0018F64F50|nr:basic proline-rich protein-like [Canis lupus familiaris]
MIANRLKSSAVTATTEATISTPARQQQQQDRGQRTGKGIAGGGTEGLPGPPTPIAHRVHRYTGAPGDAVTNSAKVRHHHHRRRRRQRRQQQQHDAAQRSPAPSAAQRPPGTSPAAVHRHHGVSQPSGTGTHSPPPPTPTCHVPLLPASRLKPSIYHRPLGPHTHVLHSRCTGAGEAPGRVPCRTRAPADTLPQWPAPLSASARRRHTSRALTPRTHPGCCGRVQAPTEARGARPVGGLGWGRTSRTVGPGAERDGEPGERPGEAAARRRDLQSAHLPASQPARPKGLGRPDGARQASQPWARRAGGLVRTRSLGQLGARETHERASAKRGVRRRSCERKKKGFPDRESNPGRGACPDVPAVPQLCAVAGATSGRPAPHPRHPHAALAAPQARPPAASAARLWGALSPPCGFPARRRRPRPKEGVSRLPSGNRTPVSRVTGGDTHHYTNEDGGGGPARAPDPSPPARPARRPPACRTTPTRAPRRSRCARPASAPATCPGPRPTRPDPPAAASARTAVPRPDSERRAPDPPPPPPPPSRAGMAAGEDARHGKQGCASEPEAPRRGWGARAAGGGGGGGGPDAGSRSPLEAWVRIPLLTRPPFGPPNAGSPHPGLDDALSVPHLHAAAGCGLRAAGCGAGGAPGTRGPGTHAAAAPRPSRPQALAPPRPPSPATFPRLSLLLHPGGRGPRPTRQVGGTALRGLRLPSSFPPPPPAGQPRAEMPAAPRGPGHAPS